MTISKQTKEYVISLTKQALVALKNNEFESAEDYLRSANGEIHDANMGINMELNYVNKIIKKRT